MAVSINCQDVIKRVKKHFDEMLSREILSRENGIGKKITIKQESRETIDLFKAAYPTLIDMLKNPDSKRIQSAGDKQRLKKTNERLVERIRQLQDELDRLKQSKDTRQMKQETDDIKHLQRADDTKHLNQIAELKTQLDDQDRFIEGLKLKILDMKTTAISEQMNMKVSADESNLENISIKNRPLNVATEFESICTSQWLAAKERLDKFQNSHQNRSNMSVAEGEKVEFLLNIFKLAERKSKKVLSENKTKIEPYLLQPMDMNADKEQHHPRTEARDPGAGAENTHPQSRGAAMSSETEVKVNNLLSDVYRVSADTVDVEPIAEYIKKSLQIKPQDAAVKAYINACARLAWKMVIQRPPMTFLFSKSSDNYDATKFEPNWGSDDPTKSTVIVKYCLAPALLQGDKVMVKGRVILKKY